MADEWKRDTPWRQGHLLPSEALSLLGDIEAGTFAVVITHDCDLASDLLEVEPNVEVLLGTLGDPSKSGNLSWGKSPRLIHLNFENEQGEKLLLEVNILQRKSVPKTELCRFEPQGWELSRAELEAFTRWLASRYRRSAFPDAFNDTLATSKLGEKLEKKFKGSGGTAITTVLFDVEEKSGAEFHLSVVLLYRDEDCHKEVEAVAESIRELFDSQKSEVSSDGVKIVLKDCGVVSEDTLTVRAYRKLQKWEKDYLSLRTQPLGEMLDEV